MCAHHNHLRAVSLIHTEGPGFRRTSITLAGTLTITSQDGSKLTLSYSPLSPSRLTITADLWDLDEVATEGPSAPPSVSQDASHSASTTTERSDLLNDFWN